MEMSTPFVAHFFSPIFLISHTIEVCLCVLFSAYSLSKYGMTLCVLGMSQEFKDDGIAVNALWPKTGLTI